MVFRIFISVLLGVLLSACAIKTRRMENQDPKAAQADAAVSLAPKKLDLNDYSLKEDRAQFDQVRAELPEPIKTENDELAGVLLMFKDYKQDPNRIRSRFDRILRNQRKKFNKDLRKERNTFSKNERQDRDRFLLELKNRKSNFDARKLNRDQKKAYYESYKDARDEYFNNARDKRKEFEAETRQKRKDFEAYVREKRSEFREELRIYKTQVRAIKRAESQKRRMERKARLKRAAESRSNMFVKPQRRSGAGEIPGLKNSFQSTSLPTAEAGAKRPPNVNNSPMSELEEFEQIYSKPANSLSTED